MRNPLIKIEFHRHNIDNEERQSLLKALDGIFITSGPLTKQFEDEFASYLNCKKVIGAYSCTTALFLCLKALGIGRGDEVITTPMTFIATSNAVIEAGATPVFIDVEKTTGNIDASLIERAISSKTKAIIPVHLYGHMCDMKAIHAIAKKHNLFVIEDAAHCIEGSRDGIRPGQISDAACFSFYATKNMTSGEGGAIATNHETLAENLLLLRSHGMNKEASSRYTDIYQHWDMVKMGYKGNMFDIQAALLLPQLSKLDDYLRKRKNIFETYSDAFKSIDSINTPLLSPNTDHAYHLYTIWVDPKRRDQILVALQNNGIGVAVNYRPVHLLTYYKERYHFKTDMFLNAEQIGQKTISLPLYPKLTKTEIESVINTVKTVI